MYNYSQVFDPTVESKNEEKFSVREREEENLE
jgi:hypothetical protein